MKIVLLALLGLALAVGVTYAASTLSSQTIGLSAEPLSAGDELAPQPEPTRTSRPKRTPEPAATATAAPPSPTAEADDGGGRGRGRGRGRGGDDD